MAGYGDYLHAVHPGSGGHIDLDDSGRWGSPGGGAVRIQAAVLELVDGSILANGSSGNGAIHEGLIIRSVAGTGFEGYDGDGGSATQAMLNGPAGVDVDDAGNIYIADSDNHCIRKVHPDGIITTVAGNGSRGYNGDNIPATSAQLSRPTDVAVDSAGNIYIADSSNQRIRKVDPNGTITTVVGRGYSGYNGDNRPASSATLYYPYGVTVDDAGRLYIADAFNSRIRKVDLNGTITTVAGTGSRGYNGDNRTATSAWIHTPYDVAVDNAGNIYIAEFYGQRIRKINESGTISTIAGTGSYGYNGDNRPAVSALLYYPTGVAVDGAGNIYIADRTNHRIRKVDSSGVIMTIAGSGNPGDSGVHGAASGAQLYSPERVAVDSDGDIVIADTSNHRVRKVAAGDFNTISPTGAGGSIRIEAGSIADAGTSSRIAANGGGLWQQEKYYTGSGGRVVLQYNEHLGINPDRVTAHGGPSSSTEGYRGSAGTVYIQRGYGPGDLKVSNSDRIENRVIASDQPTSLEVVGQHRIAAVTDLGEENWLLQIDDALAPDRSYTGYFIDPDASDTEGPYFEIVDIQGENGLIVASTDNLADIVGNDLVGVHKFTNLEIDGSANVDFGSDRIFFADTGDLQVDAAATLMAGSIINLVQFPTIDFTLDINDDLMADDLVIAEGDIRVNGRLTADNLEVAGGNLTVVDSLAVDDLVVTEGNLKVIGRLEAAHDLSVSSVDQSAVVEAGTIEVGSDAIFAGTAVIAPTIAVHGSLVLTNATSFTVPAADESAVHPLDIQVDGDMTIEAGSSVDVSAKGYAAGRTWDNAPYYAYITGGSHGGIGGVYSGDEPLESYGDYLHAVYPGSGGNFFDFYGAPGGGAVRIRALSLTLNQGVIRANGGLLESDMHPTGAGGSIDIDVNTIDLSDDTSRIEANGADSWDPDNCSYYTGAGGRVVIRYAENPGPDIESVSAHAGFSDCSNISGSAGTVYIQEGDQPGRLIVSNFNAAAGQSVSSDQPTPVEVVGRHRIISVANPQAHHWVLEIDGLLKAHREYAGYLIDVDAADADGPYYEITGTEGPSQLVVFATADLSQVAGNDLVGVHQFSQIKIASGATVDFGADRLIAPQSYGLDVGAGSALLVGGLIGGEQTVWSWGFNLTIDGDYNISTLTVSDWYLTVTGRLATTGDFYVRGVDEDAVVSSREIVVGGNAVISNATVITSDIHVQGDLTLLGDATMTTFDADETSVYPLNIQVDNELIIYSGSVVDVSGKGYARGRTWNNATYSAYQTGGSHAGIGGWSRSYEPLDVYCDYLHAQYPGSGGRSGASNGVPGGGAVRIRAAVLELDDAAILANGSMLNSAGHPSGAGGSIDIEVGEIRDTGANYRIEANGGGSWNTSRYFTGGGGRVVLRYGRDVGFDLTRVFAHGGNSGSNVDKKGSAGTVYIAPIGRAGTLKVSNLDPLSGRTVNSDLPTPMEVVGRQRIAGIEDRGDGRWAIVIRTAMEDVFEAGCLDFESEVAYHSFEILEEAAINLELDVFNVGGPGYWFDDLRIFRNDGDLTEDDFVDLSDIEFRGPPYFGATGSITLAAGSYILAIGPGPLDPDETVNGIHQECGQNSPPWIGSYELSMNADPIIGPDKNHVGYFVDLDGSDWDGPYYEIVDVEIPNRLIVASNEDLSGVADKDLVGIHLLDGLQIGGGAAADFGQDRVIVLENDGLQVEPDSGLQVGGLQVGGLSNWQDMAWPSGFTLALNSDQTVNDLTIQDWNLTVQGRLEVAADLSITGVDAEAALEADMIVVDGGAQIVNSMVIASDIDVQGDLTLLDGATITASEGNDSTDYLLDITVGNGIYLSNGSSIDVNGKGYPGGATWHNEPFAAQRTGGSHAGIGGWDYSYELLDAYGDYRHARSAGSGGNYDGSYGAPGGGAVRLDALSLQLDNGYILANGGMGTSYYDATGAGGSIAIEVDIFNVLDNNSRIAANGGGAWNARRYHTGAGGRVVLRYTDQLGLDPERVSAHGGPSSYNGDKMGSAGTVYIEQTGQPGLLKISNFDPVYGQVITSAQPTPLEVVGKRHIESVSNRVTING